MRAMGLGAKAVVGLSVLVLLATCGADDPPDGVAPTPYAGYHRLGFEQSDFYPANGEGPYWLRSENDDVWAQIRAFERDGPGRSAAVTLRLVVEGRLDVGGGFGHLGAYEGELFAERVLEIEPVSQKAFDAQLAERRGEEDD